MIFLDACEKRRIEFVDAAEMSLKYIAKRCIGDALEGT